MDKRSDHELLSDFAVNTSETAFAILVDRHIGLVYSVAFRQLHDAHLAEDVTQAVFVLLARKASTLSKNTILAGWLYRTARFISRDVLKSEARRRKREQNAVETGAVASPAEANWQQAAPHLDDALSRLAEKDRAAVLLRYFEAKSLHEVGQALGCSEEAARKRIDRAVEKLRAHLKERNALLPIEELLSNSNNDDLPAGASIRVTTAALADTVAKSANVLALVKSALELMLLTKLKHILAVFTLAALPTILLLGNPGREQRILPTAAQIINRHLAESRSASLGIHRRDEPVGTACMSCHRSDRSADEPLVTQVYARGEWQEQPGGLNGIFELRIAGPNRTLESIYVAGLGRFVRARNESAAWSIAPDGSLELLAQLEANQFKRETDLLIWPDAIDVLKIQNVERAKFSQKKSYRILENGDGFEIANYFDIQSGFRIGSTWKPDGSNALQTNLFQEYKPFDTVTFPKRIIRRRTGSEEIFTVTNLTVSEVPLRIFKPPRGL